ncbi:hypothetical protein O181_037725 [Austropuccinia psidii MF-1]|uniref:Uncharacterized protein n=1 Tax=Austropuccinia psidii MF-1 TaxID=1389203 RepID=A0A9Q3HDF2_9BASI|nr:hypothetical protein [Austropuccinia psidii MF-1]
MAIQHLPPERQTRSQARAQAVLTPTPRAPIDRTPAVPQLRIQFGRSSTIHPGKKRAKKIKFFFQEYLVVFQVFQGPLSKVLVKMVKRRGRILWKRKSLMVLKVFLLL